jgi:GTP pyrophosphokinase
VFVYTPAGDVKDLPAGSTPLDFAYSIHTDLGHNVGGALVNGKLASLNTQLKNGDTVEIRKTRAPRGPSLDWLNSDLGYLATAEAKSKVRLWFRRQERQSNIKRGRDLLHRELKKLGVTITEASLAKDMEFESADEFAYAIGTGNVGINKVLEGVTRRALVLPDELLPAQAVPELPARQERTGIVVMGAPNLLTRVAKCCSPVYGDEIVGYLTRGRGATVHRANCVNMRSTDDPDRMVPVAWGHADSSYPARLLISAFDRVGLLRDITNVVSGEHVNIHSMSSNEQAEQNACTVSLTVYTTGVDQLSRLFSRLESIQGVHSVDRIIEGEHQPSEASAN